MQGCTIYIYPGLFFLKFKILLGVVFGCTYPRLFLVWEMNITFYEQFCMNLCSDHDPLLCSFLSYSRDLQYLNQMEWIL